jgi:hypothetical protein
LILFAQAKYCSYVVDCHITAWLLDNPNKQ